MKKITLVAIVILIIFGATFFLVRRDSVPEDLTGASTIPTDNEAFPDIHDLIVLESPQQNDVVVSPLTVTGRARGMWFFEASFPVMLVNWDGLIIAQGIATAQGEWMTEEFVPFEAVLEFEKPTVYPERGALILQKDNPSGLPEFDAALEIPVRFE